MNSYRPGADKLVVIGFTVAAVFSGLATAMIGGKFGALIAGLAIAPFILQISPQNLTTAILIVGIVVSGVSGYFFNASIHWVLYLMGLAGYGILITHRISNPRESSLSHTKTPVAHWWYMLFVLSLALSTAIQPPGPYHLLVAIRDYFFLLSLYLIVFFINTRQQFLKRLWVTLFVCALIQLPVSIYQLFFVAGKRVDATKWDAIVGTFSGSQEFGGDSGNLTIFLFSVLILTIELYRSGAIRRAAPLCVGLVVAIFVAIAEVKVAFVLIAICALWYLFIGRTGLSIGSRIFILVGTILLSILLVFFYAEYRSDSSSTSSNGKLSDRIERTLSYSIDPSRVDPKGDIGRIAAVVFWGEQTLRINDPAAVLFGHGAGSTQMTKEGFGNVANKYFPLHVDTNTLAVLLWDSGLIGAISFLVALVLVLISAWKVEKQYLEDVWHAGFLRASCPILFFYALSVFYNKGLVAGSPPSQLMFALFAALAMKSRIPKRQ